MSYDNTQCPCGGTKPCSTMLCDECEQAFATHPSMEAFKDEQSPVEYQRHAAITLVSLARVRKRRP